MYFHSRHLLVLEVIDYLFTTLVPVDTAVPSIQIDFLLSKSLIEPLDGGVSRSTLV